MSNEKKILYFDMDGVLVDFASGIRRLLRQPLYNRSLLPR